MNKPLPIINELTKPYWQAAANGLLALQRCSSCRRWIHFPEPRCPHCASKTLSFEPVSGNGVIESFSVIHRSFVEGFQSEPYVIAWIALPEQNGLRVMANIINSPIEKIIIDAKVTLCFEQRGEFGKLPQFTLSTEQLTE